MRGCDDWQRDQFPGRRLLARFGWWLASIRFHKMNTEEKRDGLRRPRMDRIHPRKEEGRRGTWKIHGLEGFTGGC
jgi:hypothetical protein